MPVLEGGDTRAVPEVGLAPRKRAAGVARIDLDTGQVETGPEEPAAGRAPAQAPRRFEKLAVRWQGVYLDPGRLMQLSLPAVPPS